MNRQKIFDEIDAERKRQEQKWGTDRQQSLPGFMMIIEAELAEAKTGWMKNVGGKHAPLNEILQVAAVCVACLEKYGINGSAVSTDDIPESGGE